MVTNIAIPQYTVRIPEISYSWMSPLLCFRAPAAYDSSWM